MPAPGRLFERHQRGQIHSLVFPHSQSVTTIYPVFAPPDGTPAKPPPLATLDVSQRRRWGAVRASTGADSAQDRGSAAWRPGLAASAAPSRVRRAARSSPPLILRVA